MQLLRGHAAVSWVRVARVERTKGSGTHLARRAGADGHLTPRLLDRVSGMSHLGRRGARGGQRWQMAGDAGD